MAWRGMAWRGRQGQARHGRRGMARPGKARLGEAGEAWQGKARQGQARHGVARHYFFNPVGRKPCHKTQFYGYTNHHHHPGNHRSRDMGREKGGEMTAKEKASPPIPWEHTFWDWQAIDADGSVCVYEQKPTQGLRIWVPVSQAWLRKHMAEKPADFTKCIWERPKKNSEEV